MADERETLRYIASELNEMRRQHQRDGKHFSPRLDALRLLAASGGPERPEFAADVLAMDYETAGRKLGVSARTIRRLTASGELPRVEIAGCARITTEDLNAFVSGLRRERSA
jgi:excisionase family DNA binding protein